MTRRNAIKLGLFGGICLCSAGLASKYRIFGLCRSVTAGTPVGGRRTLNLSEGTVVELNTRYNRYHRLYLQATSNSPFKGRDPDHHRQGHRLTI